jgi:AraC-like DNA-binding protein
MTPRSTSVREAIAFLMVRGYPHVDRTALHIGCSARTLQRHLAEEGQSYRRLVDDIRFDEARRRLRTGRDRISEIAVSLGYADSGSFTRAFRRWAGVAPRVYRRLFLQK